MTTKLDWGHALPEGYRGVAWGARAIYGRHDGRVVIDLLWDRQCASGDRTDVQALCNWIDTRGLDALRAECLKQNIQASDHTHVCIESGDYIIDANPNASHGYLYICAYRRPCVECRTGVPASRVYSGVVGPFCNSSCHDTYLSRPTTSAIAVDTALTGSTPFDAEIATLTNETETS